MHYITGPMGTLELVPDGHLPGDAHPADIELDAELEAEFQVWDMLSDEAWVMIEHATEVELDVTFEVIDA